VASDESFYPEALGSMKVRCGLRQVGTRAGEQGRAAHVAEHRHRRQSRLHPEQVGDPTLGPEVTAEFETGFDASWLEDRVNVGFTYYRQITDDALLNVQPTPSLGFTNNQLMNVGKIRNSGTETSITVSPVRRESLGLDVGLNFTTNNSEVLVARAEDQDRQADPVTTKRSWSRTRTRSRRRS
jgi:outer membrane receptor protein involved in Fe transport